MWRIMVALTAWTAGTAIAVSVAWLGANVVVRNAGVGPGIPVINAAVLPASAASSPAPPPPVMAPLSPSTGAASAGATSPGPAAAPSHATASETAPAPAATGPSPSASGTASPSPGDVHAYTLAGGNVTLDMTGGSVQLVTAVPDAGYSVQTWSGTGWLRVDFSSGPQVSSLIASWYQHAPTVTVTN
jgi:hypothetical protein